MKIYHHNDMDGFGAASVFCNLYGALNPNFNNEPVEDIEAYCVNYEKDVRDKFNLAKEKEKVVILDYSFTEDTKDILESLIEKECNIVWIDHHDSSMELVKKYHEFDILKGIRSKEASGAALTYMYLHNMSEFDCCPRYIKLISDYDTFAGKLKPDSDYINIVFNSLPSAESKWNFLKELFIRRHDINDSFLLEVMNKGEIIKQYIDASNKNYCNSFSYESELEGHKVLVCNQMSNSWLFGEKYYEYPLVCVWVYNGKNYKYSIFSNDPSVNCEKIAEKYGGGGHRGAAGFTLDKLIV